MSLAVEQGIPTLYFADDSPVRVLQAMLAACTGMDLAQMDGRESVSGMEYQLLDEKMKAFSKAPLYIHESMGILTSEDFVRTVDDCIRAYGIKAVIVDCPVAISREDRPADEIDACLNDLARERGLQVVIA